MDTAIKTETTDTEKTQHFEMPAIEDDPFLKGIVPGTLSGAEMLAFWKKSGVFDVPWPQHDDIGPGKRFENSTEYVQHLRRRTETEGRE